MALRATSSVSKNARNGNPRPGGVLMLGFRAAGVLAVLMKSVAAFPQFRGRTPTISNQCCYSKRNCCLFWGRCRRPQGGASITGQELVRGLLFFSDVLVMGNA